MEEKQSRAACCSLQIDSPHMPLDAKMTHHGINNPVLLDMCLGPGHTGSRFCAWRKGNPERDFPSADRPFHTVLASLASDAMHTTVEARKKGARWSGYIVVQLHQFCSLFSSEV